MTRLNSAIESNSLTLAQIVENISHYLPTQGPVQTFVHHNTLHSFEDMNFFEGVETAAKIYSAKSYLSEGKYQQEYRKGRISQLDINHALGNCDEAVGADSLSWILGLSKRKFYRCLMLAAPRPFTRESLRWHLVEGGELRHLSKYLESKKKTDLVLRDRKLYSLEVEEAIQKLLKKLPEDCISWLPIKFSTDWRERHTVLLYWLVACDLAREVILKEKDSAVQGVNENRAGEASNGGTVYSHSSELTVIEELVNPYLIKFSSAFLDVGLSHLGIVDRSQGLLKAFLEHLRNESVARTHWLKGDFSKYEGKESIEVLEELLSDFGVSKSGTYKFLLRKALILKGWGGLVHQSEIGVSGMLSRASLSDFLAVRLLLERSAIGYLKVPNIDLDKVFGSRVSLEERREQFSSDLTLTYHIFNTLQGFGISAIQALSILETERAQIVSSILSFNELKRLRVWQKAYEWNLYSRTASAIVSRRALDKSNLKDIKAQIVCCIDDREESFRRYIEEISDQYETFGTAGFFGVDAEFGSIYERPAPFCPVNVSPTHKINLVPRSGSEQRMIGLGRLRQIQSDFGVILEAQSRSLFRGWLLAFGGILALVPLSVSTLSPRWPHRFKRYLKKVLVNPQDELALVYAREETSNDMNLYSTEEMAHRVKTLLTTTGLIKSLAPLVLITGHGSFSTNNPYRSAYDCGACGGRPGRMNPRVFASMANRSDVRAYLLANGFHMPETTYFVGAFHNTCTDEVEYFDQDLIPSSQIKIFSKLKQDIEVARSRNALERCRRFDEVSLKTTSQALAHVEARSHHIAQPRPEYGHATNAICIVGRRSISKNLFLDRRSFLVSYDPTTEEDTSLLRAILRAVVPVCMGINLEYFFSNIDNQQYGAGTKLPHNVTSLLGIMTGYCSDLRTGLPAQMVEIHEPTRLLVILDSSREKILQLLAEEAEIAKVVRNRWISLMVYEEEINKVFFFNEAKEFEEYSDLESSLPVIRSSMEWFIGKTDHLEFAEIRG